MLTSSACDLDLRGPLAEFAELGVSIVKEEASHEEDVFEVWDNNRASFEAFIACDNQWRIAAGFGFVARLGLEWPAVDILLRRRGLGDRQFEDLVVMEDAALEVFAEDRS